MKGTIAGKKAELAEKSVTVAAQLYDMRRLVRSLWGDSYDGRIADYKEQLLRICRERGECLLEGLTGICHHCVEDGHGDLVPFLSAAYVELVEEGVK